MNSEYEAYCLANRLFYDKPGRAVEADGFAISDRASPPGWDKASNDTWVLLTPDGTEQPAQGWKVHVSGTPSNAERVIETVYAHVISRGVGFKFLRSPRVVLARNAKYAGRGGSGKLITVYPRDEAELELVCRELGEILAGEPGPYILSDLRWGAGPVHVRYGGFSRRHCVDERGETVPAIEDPSGTLVPDVRGPVFALPAWVTPPECLAPHLAARRDTTVAGMSYSITEALHFSNGGGVYAATDQRTAAKVVLKEARPHAGLSADGTDAVARLRHERDVLAQLADVDAVPALLDFVRVGDHEFLVMEHVDGDPLKAALARRSPLLGSTASAGALAEYAEWALSVHGEVERAVAAIHARGIVYGDLHTFNVIVRPDGRVALIDFEVADRAGSGRRPGLGAVGFAAPRDRLGVDIDLYALACLRLALFLPLAPLVSLERAKAADLAAIVAETFPVPRAWLDEAVRVITGGDPPAPAGRLHVQPDDGGWCQARTSLAEGIAVSATPGRDDRLFPGDIAQFLSGGLNVAHGAAGVLYALDVAGAGRHPSHEEWLIRRARAPGGEARLGFYDGLHGVAHVLEHLGHRHDALEVLDMCLRDKWEAGGDDLYGGLAGMGLNFAHMADATGDAALEAAAQRATELVAARSGGVDDDVAPTSGGVHPWAGLMRGSAGRALLFVRMYERSGEPALLDHARTALRQDLRRCLRRASDGQLHVNEGWRTIPYLAMGSVGIGLVIRRYLAHRTDDELADAADAIRLAACSLFYVQSGLFGGRAGMVLYLSDGRRPGEPPDAALAAQIRRLRWHALTFEGHLAFPGDQLLRLSMDLATGSAGVLLALGAALHDRPVHLPFLGPPRPRQAVPDHQTDDQAERR
jgi:tRNA A-37 threonylcarbamoyl transferase component Bud32